MTHKDAALKEMYRVLKPGGSLLVEFSKVYKPLEGVNDPYFSPTVADYGQLDCQRCRQLPIPAESIRYAPTKKP